MGKQNNKDEDIKISFAKAKPPCLFSILFYLFSGNDNLVKREKRRTKR